MNTQIISIAVAVFAVLGWQTQAQIYDTNGAYVETFAGSGLSGHIDGVGLLTMFNEPESIVADSHGNLFVLDAGNACIRKITPDGTVSTFAGGGTKTTGVGTNVTLSGLGTYGAMTIDQNDTIWAIANPVTVYLYKIDKNANVTLTSLPLQYPTGICSDSYGNLYISDQIKSQIYRYDTNGLLTVFAGSGNQSYADGNGIFTAFYFPSILTADAANNIYVWDGGNNLIRRIDQSQNVTTFAGQYQDGYPVTDGIATNAVLHNVSGMCFDKFGNLIFTDSAAATGSGVRRISATDNITTIAGSVMQNAYTNGIGNQARFDEASGVCVSGGTIYVSDTGNQRIRSITNNPTSLPVTPANLQLNTYSGLQIVGNVGRTYQVQSSPDMSTWTTETTVLLNSTPYLWIDQTPIAGNKFYRAVMLP
jgi:sugar lactone lactonase YvrE